MKYAAEVSSEKGGRVARKAADQVNITIYRGNKEIGYMTIADNEIGIEVYEAQSTEIVSPGPLRNIAAKEIRFYGIG